MNIKLKEDNNIIELKVIDGSIKKKEIKYNKDGTIRKVSKNKIAGESSEVYAFRTQEEINNMIKHFNKQINNANNNEQKQIAYRNKMLFVIGINLGIRGSDLCNLKWNKLLYDDLTFRDCIKIKPKKTEKTGKYVLLGFNKAVKNIIKEYSSIYPINNLDDYIFKSRKGNEPISRMSAGRIIKNAAKEIGIKQNINSHSLRKTWGYHIYNSSEDKGQALVMLQKCFGHSNQLTTMKYIGIYDDDVINTYNSISLGI